MAVTRISQSSLKQGLKKNKNFVADIPPVLGRYYALASETVGAGGAASIDFTNIPTTYKHLQIRMISRVSGTTGTGSWFNHLRLGTSGTIDTGANYTWHRMYSDIGTGVVGADSGVSQGQIYFDRATRTGDAANIFAATICDILDYASTSKNKVIRTLAGSPTSFQYDMYLESGLWVNTGAIDTIKILPASPATSFVQYTTTSLYGIK